MEELNQVIQDTLEQAQRHGLEIEVLSSAFLAVQNGTDIAQALDEALVEWDL